MAVGATVISTHRFDPTDPIAASVCVPGAGAVVQVIAVSVHAVELVQIGPPSTLPSVT